ncbi:RimK family alpha-L-glutamate ligase [Thiorhodococcus minor]|uniref:RimK family alpha-L-glutamate ligase n=2 Tax=Thiorhodococcus minor TaxID=57489 RepID=A0A6M0K365_9GAMM|nr:RimK family alpha-L-glutamate ligase [Thiorhodococcus minor]
MHGWILYTGKVVPELTRACDEALAAGVKLEVVAPKEVALILDPEEPAKLFLRGELVRIPMFVIAAFVEEADAYNLALLQQLETQGVLCVNRAETLKRTGDKLLTLQLLAGRGIPVPKTVLVRPDTSPAFIAEQLGLPVVVKVLDGSKGHGVALVQSQKELETLLEMMDAAHCPTALLAQEFVADSRGRDLRVLVVDGQPRVCMQRRNRSAEGFKSNVSVGGSAEAYPLTDTIRALAEQVIAVIGLDIGGIDLLFKGDGFVVGEANSIPGFQGIESSSAVNVPAEILMSIGRRLQQRSAARYRALADQVRSLDDLRPKKEAELVQTFVGACAALEQTQQRVLIDILQRSAETEFGKARGFAGIRTIEDFRRQVPVTEWSDYAPYASRMEDCEKDLLFPGQPTHFISTSGTTGAFKKIPESAAGELAKSIVSRTRIALLMKMAPELLDGFFIPLSNGAVMGKTACGIPFGFASGLTLAGAPPEIRKRLAFPPEVLEASDAETLDYLIMRYAVAKPRVRLLVGNNPGRMTSLLETADRRRDSLIGDIERGTLSPDLDLPPDLRQQLEADLAPDPERASALRQMAGARGRLEPRDYWPGLRMVSCWLGGTIGRYLDSLMPWLPEGVVFSDCGYGASEGKLNIPMQPGGAEAPLAIFGYFFEFQPLSGGEPLLAHQLRDGEEYGLIITTYSGLYRYNLHDIVRVKGFTGETPNIQFVSKTRDVANLAGEKLNGAFISDVIRQALAAEERHWRHFCVVTDSEAHRYEFCIEPEGDDAPDAAWLHTIDAALIREASGYQLLRAQGLIRAPRLHVMASGWLDRLYAQHVRPGVTTSQVKLPLVCDAVPQAEMTLRSLDL